MVHLAIDGMWQVFKLQRSTPRNDFCRIAAKNGILLRLINTLYSLNEATRLATISVGGGFPLDGSAQRPRSGSLDPTHPIFVQNEASLSATDQLDLTKVRHGVVDNHLSTVTSEPSRTSISNSQRADGNQSDLLYHHMDTERPQSSNAAPEASVPSKLPDPTSLEKAANLATKEASATISRADVDHRQQRTTISGNRISTDRPPKLMEGASNGFPTTLLNQQEHVRPLLSLLDKEPPSRHFSGQLEYVRHLSGLERHETILPLLHASNEKKTNGELDFLMAEFAGNFYLVATDFKFLILKMPFLSITGIANIIIDVFWKEVNCLNANFLPSPLVHTLHIFSGLLVRFRTLRITIGMMIQIIINTYNPSFLFFTVTFGLRPLFLIWTSYVLLEVDDNS